MDLENYYESLGVKREVFEYCKNVEDGLKSRFEAIDKIAELNQLKVIKAMQDNHVSDYHFNSGTGYGYNDDGRDALKKFMPIYFTQKMLLYVHISHAEPTP